MNFVHADRYRHTHARDKSATGSAVSATQSSWALLQVRDREHSGAAAGPLQRALTALAHIRYREHARLLQQIPLQAACTSL